MDTNRIIILALIAIIIALLIGVVAMMPNLNKKDTDLTLMANDTISEGDYIEVKLADANGTALANQTVDVTVTDNNNASSSYSVVTDESGFGALKLDKIAGDYDITVIYAGNDGYNGCNATKRLTIKEKVVEATVEPTAKQTSSKPQYLSDTGEPISEADYNTLKVYGKSANSKEEWEAQKASLGY